MKYLFFSIVFVMFFACKNTKNSTAENTLNQNISPTDSTYRFNVSFISIGAGTDIKAKKQFDQYITEYEQNNGLKLNYEIISWGREGEVDYCFDLLSLDKETQKQFIIETKKNLEKSSLVRYSENSDCPQK